MEATTGGSTPTLLSLRPSADERLAASTTGGSLTGALGGSERAMLKVNCCRALELLEVASARRTRRARCRLLEADASTTLQSVAPSHTEGRSAVATSEELVPSGTSTEQVDVCCTTTVMDVALGWSAATAAVEPSMKVEALVAVVLSTGSEYVETRMNDSGECGGGVTGGGGTAAGGCEGVGEDGGGGGGRGTPCGSAGGGSGEGLVGGGREGGGAKGGGEPGGRPGLGGRNGGGREGGGADGSGDDGGGNTGGGDGGGGDGGGDGDGGESGGGGG
mmetsp:Transcript_34388/g.100958  ORF Transcript_34388/g.100958 Transcript_34388/m.100958 type:complete len:276 (+) Transcript_34388:222-1049(+)